MESKGKGISTKKQRSGWGKYFIFDGQVEEI
jgi:hypothetical protein